MVTTDRSDLDQIARSLRDHGASQGASGRTGGTAFLLPEFNRIGFNYRMTDMQGALGCAQMDRLQWVLAQRTRYAQMYDEQLRRVEWLTTPKTPKDYVHGYQAYVCLFRPETPSLNNLKNLHDRRNELMARLQDKGIATRQGTHAPVIQSYYRQKYGLHPEQFPQAYIADQLSLALPLYPQMSESDHTYVVETLTSLL